MQRHRGQLPRDSSVERRAGSGPVALRDCDPASARAPGRAVTATANGRSLLPCDWVLGAILRDSLAWMKLVHETSSTWRRYCLRHNRLLTRAAPYGADSEPRTSESGCAITYDVLFNTIINTRTTFSSQPRSWGWPATRTARLNSAGRERTSGRESRCPGRRK